MSTQLDLLARDGAVHVVFSEDLTAAQYDELQNGVRAAETKAELVAAVTFLGIKWGIRVETPDA